MDREELEALIVRLESLGHAPKNIYETLVKRFDPCLVETLIGEVTGWHKRGPKPKPKVRIIKPKRVPKPKLPAMPKGPRKGHPMSPETRAKLAAFKTQWWQDHRHEVIRLPPSDEVRAKISASSRARRASPETRAKQSLAMKLHWQARKGAKIEDPDPVKI